MLNVVMLNVVMLSVVAPINQCSNIKTVQPSFYVYESILLKSFHFCLAFFMTSVSFSLESYWTMNIHYFHYLLIQLTPNGSFEFDQFLEN